MSMLPAINVLLNADWTFALPVSKEVTTTTSTAMHELQPNPSNFTFCFFTTLFTRSHCKYSTGLLFSSFGILVFPSVINELTVQLEIW